MCQKATGENVLQQAALNQKQLQPRVFARHKIIQDNLYLTWSLQIYEPHFKICI